jgi:hypothetical protein
MALQNSSITSSGTTIYQNTTSGNVAITCVIFCNIEPVNPIDDDHGLTFLTLYAVASGSSPGLNNIIVNALPIPASETVTFDHERFILGPGDRLIASSSSPEFLSCTVSWSAV